VNGNLWNRVLEHVRPKVNLRSYSTWLEPTRLHSVEGKTISVMVPNPLHATWIPNYTKLISEALLEITGEPWEVTFFSAEGDLREQSNQTTGLPAPVGVMEPARPSVDKNGQAYLDGVFNPCYTFGTFVEGTGNAFALAAARAVAEKPFRSHNPLYIFGKVGLGKTHLMHAIGNHLAASGRPLKIRYATTETFMNELITAIRTGKTMAFKDMYRSVDVLLVDDMQFLAKKERTQEEFFHTFNALYDMRKQIVMTCDCAPHEIPDLEERLRSRFQWGLIADIGPPDLETRIAILSKKAEAGGVELPSDVALFIASKVKSNVRELEGCLIRVLAHASFNRREVDINLAKDCLRDIYSDEKPAIAVEAIQKQVSVHFDLKMSEIKSKNNGKAVVFPRQVAMYLCKKLTAQSYKDIGEKFGRKHHTTVIHAVRKVDQLRRTDRDLDRLLDKLENALR